MIFIPMCPYHHSIQTQIQPKHSPYFISIVKVHVSILNTDHHWTSYKKSMEEAKSGYYEISSFMVSYLLRFLKILDSNYFQFFLIFMVC